MKKLCMLVCVVVLLFFTAGTSTAVPYLEFYGFTVDDDNSGNSVGNSDGIIDPGELIELYIHLINSGDTDAGGVSATLSTSSSYVTFLFNTSSTYSPDPLTAGAVGTNSDDFDFQVDSLAPIGQEIFFDLSISDYCGTTWSDNFSIVVGGVSVPEPAILFLLSIGLAGLAAITRKC